MTSPQEKYLAQLLQAAHTTISVRLLAEAIYHLDRLLNEQRTATQAWADEKAARDWLDSIGR